MRNLYKASIFFPRHCSSFWAERLCSSVQTIAYTLQIIGRNFRETRWSSKIAEGVKNILNVKMIKIHDSSISLLFRFDCFSNTFAIIIIGPKRQWCKLGPFCLQQWKQVACRRQQTKGGLCPWKGREKGEASIFYTSEVSQGFGALQCFIHMSYCQRSHYWPLHFG